MIFLLRDTIIPDHKELHCALVNIWGVGRNKALYVLNKLGIPTTYFTSNLNKYHTLSVTSYFGTFTVSSVRIKRSVVDRITFLISSGTLRGLRHKWFLPLRGQRTRTNAGTMRSRRQTQSLWSS